jgi:hypothetical protein
LLGNIPKTQSGGIRMTFEQFLKAKGLNENQIEAVIKRLQEKKANSTDKMHYKLFQANKYINV